jgi:hypothetical protein
LHFIIDGAVKAAVLEVGGILHPKGEDVIGEFGF